MSWVSVASAGRALPQRCLIGSTTSFCRTRDARYRFPTSLVSCRGPGGIMEPIQQRRHTVSTKTRATLEDLYKVEGKAELVNGEIVHMPPSGDEPSSAGFEIAANLKDYARRIGRGRAYPDGTGFHVNLPHRESFSPDAAYHVGSRTGMRFLEGAPIFAVEVRSEGDYGSAAETAIAKKRSEYFAAGTLAIWDVNLLSDDVIKLYSIYSPDVPRIFRRADIADAEPAVPGWSMQVDDLFVD